MVVREERDAAAGGEVTAVKVLVVDQGPGLTQPELDQLLQDGVPRCVR